MLRIYLYWQLEEQTTDSSGWPIGTYELKNTPLELLGHFLGFATHFPFCVITGESSPIYI